MKKLTIMIFGILFITGCIQKEEAESPAEQAGNDEEALLEYTVTVKKGPGIEKLAEEARKIGEKAFKEGESDALAAIYENQAQQIDASAILFHMTNGRPIKNIGELIGGYLTSIPIPPAAEAVPSAKWQFDIENKAAFIDLELVRNSGMTIEICQKINEQTKASCHIKKQNMKRTMRDLTNPTGIGQEVTIYYKV